MYKTNRLQRIKKILMREVFPTIALNVNTMNNIRAFVLLNSLNSLRKGDKCLTSLALFFLLFLNSPSIIETGNSAPLNRE